MTPEGFFEISCSLAPRIVDPTGCGDAFRAGFLHEYLKGSPLLDCCKKGSEMGSLAIGFSGGQNHCLK